MDGIDETTAQTEEMKEGEMATKTPRAQKPRPVTMEIEQVKQIYDYTKFHIGLYFTLLTGLVALVTLSKKQNFEQSGKVLLAIILLLLVGGVAGALVASRIVYGPWTKECFDLQASGFWRKWEKQLTRNSWWSWADVCLVIEHYAFWIALFVAIITFALPTLNLSPTAH
jgi:hypothetical protein